MKNHGHESFPLKIFTLYGVCLSLRVLMCVCVSVCPYTCACAYVYVCEYLCVCVHVLSVCLCVFKY